MAELEYHSHDALPETHRRGHEINEGNEVNPQLLRKKRRGMKSVEQPPSASQPSLNQRFRG